MVNALFCLVLLLVLLGFSPRTISAQTSIPALPAKTFLDSMGVNVHMEYTDSQYANVGNVSHELEYLGITHVRDAIPSPSNWLPHGQGLAAIHTLANLGVRFDIFVNVTDLPTDLRQLISLQQFRPGMISSIEGPNEINNWPVTYRALIGQVGAESFQRDLYQAVRSNPLLSGIPVCYFTGGRRAAIPNLQGLADLANVHSYPHHGEQPLNWLINEFSRDYSDLESFPRVITEVGYYTLPSSTDWGGVDYLTQAKGILTIFFDAAKMGVQTTYLYQLLDAYADAPGTRIDAHFGLFDAQNVPKRSAFAVHNLTSFLKDSAKGAAALAYQFNGLPRTAQTLLLGKSDGSFVIAVWNETPMWDESQREPIQSAPAAASLCFRQPVSVVEYDPLTGASRPRSRVAACIPVDVPDHPILLAVKIDGKR